MYSFEKAGVWENYVALSMRYLLFSLIISRHFRGVLILGKSHYSIIDKIRETAPCLMRMDSPYKILADLADLAFCGVRDPPFTTEFSIANASSAEPARISLCSNPGMKSRR